MHDDVQRAIELESYYSWEKNPEIPSHVHWITAERNHRPFRWAVSCGDLNIEGDGLLKEVVELAMLHANERAIMLAPEISFNKLENNSNGPTEVYGDTANTLINLGLWRSDND